nr:hypothetical protein [Anaeromassilibacillus senegalensis]
MQSFYFFCKDSAANLQVGKLLAHGVAAEPVSQYISQIGYFSLNCIIAVLQGFCILAVGRCGRSKDTVRGCLNHALVKQRFFEQGYNQWLNVVRWHVFCLARFLAAFRSADIGLVFITFFVGRGVADHGGAALPTVEDAG